MPPVHYQPKHQRLARQFDILLRNFENEPRLNGVRDIRYRGEDGSIYVRLKTKVRDSGIAKYVSATWRELPVVFEADLWDDLLQEKLHNIQMRNWLGSIIWWDRSDKARGEHKERWNEFAEKYCHPYYATSREVLLICSDLLTPSEKQYLRDIEMVTPKNLQDLQQRYFVTHRLRVYQDKRLASAMETMEYNT